MKKKMTTMATLLSLSSKNVNPVATTTTTTDIQTNFKCLHPRVRFEPSVQLVSQSDTTPVITFYDHGHPICDVNKTAATIMPVPSSNALDMETQKFDEFTEMTKNKLNELTTRIGHLADNVHTLANINLSFDDVKQVQSSKVITDVMKENKKFKTEIVPFLRGKVDGYEHRLNIQESYSKLMYDNSQRSKRKIDELQSHVEELSKKIQKLESQTIPYPAVPQFTQRPIRAAQPQPQPQQLQELRFPAQNGLPHGIPILNASTHRVMAPYPNMVTVIAHPVTGQTPRS